MEELIRKLDGPICVVGCNGFIGRRLLNALCNTREEKDVVGVGNNTGYNFQSFNTIFHLAGYYGKDVKLLKKSNIDSIVEWMENIKHYATIVHAGSAMEYDEPDFSLEGAITNGMGAYGESKRIGSNMIRYFGKHFNVRCANLRLYCVYGPSDHENNLIPTVIREGKQGRLPKFTEVETTRDFIHVDDVCRAFVMTALNLKPENYGESFNIGTGVPTSIREVAYLAKEVFNIKEEPQFTRPKGPHDYPLWYANTEKAEKLLGFKAQVKFEDGFRSLAGV